MAKERGDTRSLLAQYVDDYVSEPARAVDQTSQSSVETYQRFRVGPFQFVIAAHAVTWDATNGHGAAAIDAAELVPARYRDHLGPGAPVRPQDRLVLKRGRIAIEGCWCEGQVGLPANAIVARGARPTAPWILGSVREPACFVLDPDALLLHVLRRVDGEGGRDVSPA